MEPLEVSDWGVVLLVGAAFCSAILGVVWSIRKERYANVRRALLKGYESLKDRTGAELGLWEEDMRAALSVGKFPDWIGEEASAYAEAFKVFRPDDPAIRKELQALVERAHSVLDDTLAYCENELGSDEAAGVDREMLLSVFKRREISSSTLRRAKSAVDSLKK